jgi:hypothetical protein
MPRESENLKRVPGSFARRFSDTIRVLLIPFRKAAFLRQDRGLAASRPARPRDPGPRSCPVEAPPRPGRRSKGWGQVPVSIASHVLPGRIRESEERPGSPRGTWRTPGRQPMTASQNRFPPGARFLGTLGDATIPQAAPQQRPENLKILSTSPDFLGGRVVLARGTPIQPRIQDSAGSARSWEKGVTESPR